jgi:hypothetical protein
MRQLMRLHRLLSCLAAPLMIFFAISGGWQIFRLQEAKKDGSYVPPPALETLSHMHKAERLAGAPGEAFRWLLLLSAAIFLTSAVIGVVMALRITKPRWMVLAWLGAGVVLPVLLFVAAQK